MFGQTVAAAKGLLGAEKNSERVSEKKRRGHGLEMKKVPKTFFFPIRSKKKKIRFHLFLRNCMI